MNTRLAFFAGLSVLLAIAVTPANAAEGFSFITICDPRPSNFSYPAGRDALTEDLNQIPNHLPEGWPSPEFVFYAGDIDLPSVTEEAYLNAIEDVNGLCHVFVVGNHEISPTYCIQEVKDHYPTMLASLPVGASVTMNSPTPTNDTMFMIEYQNAAFVTLDIYYDETTWVDTGVLYNRVMQFVNTALGATNKPVKFVFYHEPCFPDERHVGDSLDAEPDKRDAFWNLLVWRDVTATYVGHDHWSDMDEEVRGIHEMDAGVSGLMAGGSNEPVPTLIYTLVTPGGVCLYRRAQPASGRDWAGGVNYTDVKPPWATNPNPPDGATGVDLDADLSWTAGEGAVSHDVYFGTTSPGTFQGNQTETTYVLDTLEPATTYYWVIDEHDSSGLIIYGDVRSFTTLILNESPVANDDSAATNEDTPVIVEVLANDSDAEQDPLTVASVTQGAHGSVMINADDTVTYTPNSNFSGTDSFTYKANDGNSDSEPATVTITVNNVDDDPPVAVDDSAATNEDTAIVINVLGNDSDPEGAVLTVDSVTQGTIGSVTINPDNTLTYTPDENTSGDDSFTYTISDETGNTDTATVNITVVFVNDSPVAVPDLYSVDEDNTLSVDALSGVLTNDTDEESDPLSAVLVSDVGNGTLTLNSDGSLIYTPDADFSGGDSFTYKANDGNSDSDPATVTITVNAVADPPAITSTPVTTATENTQYTYDVEATDPDVGDTLTYSLTTKPAGMTIDSGTGLIQWTPTNEQTGDHDVVVQVADAAGATDTQSFTITVSKAPPPTMHVDSIVVTKIDLGKGFKKGRAEVVILDAGGTPVSGASVTGTFTEDISETLTVSTDSSGLAVLETTTSVPSRCHLTFCVDNVTHTTLQYDSNDNVESCDKNY